MSKLGTLVAIPLGLFAIKQLQKQFPDEKDPKPVVLEPKIKVEPIVPIIPKGPTAKPAEPIIPFKTLDQRAKEAALIAQQRKQTRADIERRLRAGFGL